MQERHPSSRRPLLVLAAALILAATYGAVAGDTFGLDLGRRSKGARLTNQPRLTFVRGVLERGHRSGWQLQDGTRLEFSKSVQWLEETTGQPSVPRAGRLVMIAGQRYGAVLVVRQATLMDRSRQVEGMTDRPSRGPDDVSSDRRLPS